MLVRLSIVLARIRGQIPTRYLAKRDDFPLLKTTVHQRRVGVDFPVGQQRRTEAATARVVKVFEQFPQVEGFEGEWLRILFRETLLLLEFCLGEVDYFCAKAGIKRVRSAIAVLI